MMKKKKLQKIINEIKPTGKANKANQMISNKIIKHDKKKKKKKCKRIPKKQNQKEVKL